MRAAKAAPQATDAQALPPSTTRLNKYNAWLRVRVDEDRLAKSTTRAMQIARGYGGYVSSVDMNTPGQHGTASLVLRVPVTKVEDAVLRLGQLGEVTAQRVRIQDLQREANVLQREILKLQATIAALERKAAKGTLTPQEQYELVGGKVIARHKDEGARNDGARRNARHGLDDVLRAAAGGRGPARAGRLGRTLSHAGDFLVLELSWLLYALIVIGPIALLAAAAVLTVRAARRRSDARLLEGA